MKDYVATRIERAVYKQLQDIKHDRGLVSISKVVEQLLKAQK